MLHLRNSLLRALPASASTSSIVARNSRSFVPITTPSSTLASCYSALTRPQRSAVTLNSLRRFYATEGEGEKSTKGAFESAGESLASSAGDTAREARKDAGTEAGSSSQESFMEETKDKIASAAHASVDAVNSAIRGGDRPRRDDTRQYRDNNRVDGGYQRNTRERQRVPRVEPEPEEAKGNLYCGNLYFDVTEDQLRSTLAEFGEIESVKIIRDNRGMSKGFGYVKMASVDDAVQARNTLDGTQLENRRLVIQHSINAGPKSFTGESGITNPVSKTLFIGNLSYDLTNEDLNELFKTIEGVHDVRVAVDRRTGSPRGFAHADFHTAAQAEAAVELLKATTFHGRRLRVDFSASQRG